MRCASRRLLGGLVVALAGLLLTGVVLAGVPAAAQEPPAPDPSGQTGAVEITGIDLGDFPTVRLRVAVSGTAAAAPLAPGDFTVTENDVPVAVGSDPLSDQVVAVVLVIDTSASMAGPPLDAAKQAALQLVGQLPGSARLGVVGFGTQAGLVSTFSTDRSATSAAITGLAPEGDTALYDAVVLAAQQAGASDADRTAVLVLTDGADSGAGATLDDATAAVQAAGTDVYAIALQTEQTDEVALAGLAEAAGGQVVEAADPAALAAAYLSIGQSIVNQYELTYESVSASRVADIVVGVGEDQGGVEIALPDIARPEVAVDETATTAPTTRPLPEPLRVEIEAGPLEQDWAVFAGAAAVAAAVVALLAVAVPRNTGTRDRRRSLRSDADTASRPTSGNVVGRAVQTLRAAATRVSSRAVERADEGGAIDSALDRAGLVMRAGEFVAVTVAVAAGAGLLGFLLFGPVPGLILAVGALLAAPSFLRQRARARNRKFAEQLGDALVIMSGSLRSGFGLGQAVDTVAEEMDRPLSAEFQRALLEIRLGRSTDDALLAVARRVENEDFEWVVDAIRINQQVGGELASILDQVSETIRARQRLRRQVDALTAEGKISALVLSLLPVGLGVVLYSSNPDYLEPLFTRTGGQIMLAVGLSLLVAGMSWLRKLVQIEY